MTYSSKLLDFTQPAFSRILAFLSIILTILFYIIYIVLPKIIHSEGNITPTYWDVFLITLSLCFLPKVDLTDKNSRNSLIGFYIVGLALLSIIVAYFFWSSANKIGIFLMSLTMIQQGVNILYSLSKGRYPSVAFLLGITTLYGVFIYNKILFFIPFLYLFLTVIYTELDKRNLRLIIAVESKIQSFAPLLYISLMLILKYIRCPFC